MSFTIRMLLCGMVVIAAAAAPGCDDQEVRQSTGPVEGKRLDGGDGAVAAKPATPPATQAGDDADATDPLPDGSQPQSADADSRKKRAEWRDKKTGTPDADDPIAQANLALRPELAKSQADAANAKAAAEAEADISSRTPSKSTDESNLPSNDLSEGVAKAAADSDPTALSKPLTDPNAPAPFVDPNNPDFVPADRNLWKKFDITKLKTIDGYLAVSFSDLSGFPYAGMTGATEPQPEPDKTETKTDDGKTTDAQTDVKPDDKTTKQANAPSESTDPKHTIPAGIKALHGKKVVVSGYMMPIDFEDGGTNEFVLTRTIPSCFYCQPPQLNDWVEVKMKDGKRVPYVPDGIVELYGTIEVGELREDGFIINLYRMTGDNLVEKKVE